MHMNIYIAARMLGLPAYAAKAPPTETGALEDTFCWKDRQAWISLHNIP
jgi:hypothetical protein